MTPSGSGSTTDDRSLNFISTCSMQIPIDKERTSNYSCKTEGLMPPIILDFIAQEFWVLDNLPYPKFKEPIFPTNFSYVYWTVRLDFRKQNSTILVAGGLVDLSTPLHLDEINKYITLNQTTYSMIVGQREDNSTIMKLGTDDEYPFLFVVYKGTDTQFKNGTRVENIETIFNTLRFQRLHMYVNKYLFRHVFLLLTLCKYKLDVE